MEVRHDISPDIVCAENIGILHFLHNVPAKPSSRNAAQLIENDTNGLEAKLPIKIETRFTSILALLSGLREDVNRVSAVALRELPQSPTIEVLIAVNKASPTSGDLYLCDIKSSFESYFRIIAEASGPNNPALELLLFKQILICCKERILSRLRFKRQKRGKQRPAIQDGLQTLSSAPLADCDEARNFVEETRKLIASLQSFSNHRVTEELGDVVENASSWNQMKDLSHLFKRIPTKVLPPDLYPTLRTIIGKIGQYRVAARGLYRLTRDFPILRGPRITIVKLSPAHFEKTSLGAYTPSLDFTLQRTAGSEYSSGLLGMLCELMKKTPEEAQSAFAALVERTLGESKIHAEVQILAYSRASRSDRMIPRIVQSNKKACFLCDELFRVAKESNIMKSHGRLYETWRPPMINGLKDLQSGLNSVLSDKARASISAMMGRRQRMGFPAPNESSALSSNTTTTGIAEIYSECIPNHESNPPDTREASTAPPTARESPDTDDDLDPTVSLDVGLGTDSSRTDSSLPSLEIPALDPGQTRLAYRSQGSQLWMEYTVGPNYEGLEKPLHYQIRTLDTDETNLLRKENGSHILESRSMKPGSEIAIAPKSCYLIDFGHSIIEVKLEN